MKLLTTAQAAARINAKFKTNVLERHIKALYLSGRLPEAPRFGHKRVLTESDLPGIILALAERGYIPPMKVPGFKPGRRYCRRYERAK